MASTLRPTRFFYLQGSQKHKEKADSSSKQTSKQPPPTTATMTDLVLVLFPFQFVKSIQLPSSLRAPRVRSDASPAFASPSASRCCSLALSAATDEELRAMRLKDDTDPLLALLGPEGDREKSRWSNSSPQREALLMFFCSVPGGGWRSTVGFSCPRVDFH